HRLTLVDQPLRLRIQRWIDLRVPRPPAHLKAHPRPGRHMIKGDHRAPLSSDGERRLRGDIVGEVAHRELDRDADWSVREITAYPLEPERGQPLLPAHSHRLIKASCRVRVSRPEIAWRRVWAKEGARVVGCLCGHGRRWTTERAHPVAETSG